ncbi:MAG TPA: response regulator transcription factor [Terriglobia bacterium]|jgi:DNA-binding NarL/FixJ family response regulator|nr:response regulator transcription factor [Terriglobia bacterium]
MPKGARSHRPAVCLLASHPLARAELERLLARPGFRVKTRKLEFNFGAGQDPSPLPRAQVFVIDAHAPHKATEMLVARIQDRYPKARQLVVAETISESSAFALLRLGAKGLVTYTQATEQLSRALVAVASGGYWVPRKLLARFVDSILNNARVRSAVKGSVGLSRREKEVLDALLENLSNKEIANKLNISERTAKFHVSRLLTKFNVQRRADLILLCYQEKSLGAS